MTDRITEPLRERLVDAGRVALSRGLLAWHAGVQEPTRKAWKDPAFADDRAWIDATIRTADGLGWSRCSPLVSAFRWDGDFEWCGAFAAYCWARAVTLDVRRRYYASTYRLDRYGKHRRAFAERVPAVAEWQRRAYLAIGGDGLEVDEFGPRAGDILIVGGAPGSYGTHITIVERWDSDAETFSTVEGNATGRGPKGDRYQGVVRRERDLSECRRLIRPGLCDLENT